MFRSGKVSGYYCFDNSFYFRFQRRFKCEAPVAQRKRHGDRQDAEYATGLLPTLPRYQPYRPMSIGSEVQFFTSHLAVTVGPSDTCWNQKLEGVVSWVQNYNAIRQRDVAWLIVVQLAALYVGCLAAASGWLLLIRVSSFTDTSHLCRKMRLTWVVFKEPVRTAQ